MFLPGSYLGRWMDRCLQSLTNHGLAWRSFFTALTMRRMIEHGLVGILS
jgi:hypothetical protein